MNDSPNRKIPTPSSSPRKRKSPSKDQDQGRPCLERKATPSCGGGSPPKLPKLTREPSARVRRVIFPTVPEENEPEEEASPDVMDKPASPPLPLLPSAASPLRETLIRMTIDDEHDLFVSLTEDDKQWKNVEGRICKDLRYGKDKFLQWETGLQARMTKGGVVHLRQTVHFLHPNDMRIGDGFVDVRRDGTSTPAFRNLQLQRGNSRVKELVLPTGGASVNEATFIKCERIFFSRFRNQVFGCPECGPDTPCSQSNLGRLCDFMLSQ